MSNEMENSPMDEIESVVLLRQRKIEGKKTSEDWNKIFKYRILDPDGWDRKNYDYSFKEEEITWDEFMQRLFRSTISLDHSGSLYQQHVREPRHDITEEKGNQIYEIEHIRTRNNSLWMELLRIALKHAPEEAKKVLRKINENDNAVSRLLKELVDE
jgi:hypothetical protein